jgi:type IV secretion system protein TrbJ
MKKYFKGILGTLSLAAAIVTGPAHALFGVGDIVIDPTNLIQNTSSAISAVKNEVNTAHTYITQVQQLIAMGKSLQSVSGLANLAGVQEEYKLYVQLANVSTQLLGVIDRSKRLTESVQAQVGASNLDWKTFLTTKSDINRSRAMALSQQYQAIDRSMVEVAERRKQIVNQLQASTGQTSAMQSVGAGIDVLIGQNQQMISALQMQGRAEEMRQEMDKATEKASFQQGLQVISERQRALRQTSDQFK